MLQIWLKSLIKVPTIKLDKFIIWLLQPETTEGNYNNIKFTLKENVNFIL